MAIQLEIHGKKIPYEGGPCSLYGSGGGYALITQSAEELARKINNFPLDDAVRRVGILVEESTEQMAWTTEPPPIVSAPLFGGMLQAQRHAATPLSEAKPLIENTYRLATAVLNALKGK